MPKHRGRRFPAALLAVLAAVALGGCAGLGGSHGLPADPMPQPAYPDVSAVPPSREDKTLSDAERDRTEAELRDLATSRQRAVERKLSTGQ